jgi:hypothetical protein
VYLEEFMAAEFSQTSLTNLDDFVTFMTRNEFEQGEPVTAEYRSTGLFNPSSIFLPTVRELNMLVQDAFKDDNLAEYVQRVQALPSANPFSGTETVVFEQLSNSTTTQGTRESTSSFVRAGVAAAAAGIVVLAAGLAVMRSRRNDVDEEESFPQQKGVSSESTVAGETCNMSVDDSTVAQWKTPPRFQNETLDEEFEDEPLDSDDDDAPPQLKPRPESLVMSSS